MEIGAESVRETPAAEELPARVHGRPRAPAPTPGREPRRSEPRGRISERRSFGGSTVPEVAEVPDASGRAGEDDGRVARARLERELSA